MNSIPGFSLAEVLLAERTGTLLRGTREGKSVLLQVPTDEYPEPVELARRRYGYELSASLELPGVARGLAFIKHGNRVATVLEDFGGRPLRHLLEARDLSIVDALEVGERLARTIGELHRQRIIHKNITPSTVLVHPQTLEVRLTGFDIASRLPLQNPELVGHDRLEGSLAYISPEQTGRMNRGVDYRSDFYSLGVTLYELLTGRPPFLGLEPVALVYSHLAVEPLPVHEVRPEVPRLLSAVVMKLLAKSAEERYQSAHGLMTDLQACLRQLRASGTIADFTPGHRDDFALFRLPQKLYGREEEVAWLLQDFERVSQGGKAELLLVSGYSGVGKSSLVNEVQQPLVRAGGYFGMGKFDQVQNAPYKAWIQAFDGLLRQILSEKEALIAAWRERLLAALGANAQVIVDVIPQLGAIIGPQPAVPALGPTESQNRFNLMFQRFVGAFAQPEHPLVLFLDDLQWADAASLGLLHLIFSDPDCRHLFVMGAYRDNEVLAGHGLLSVLAELRRVGTSIAEISLRPLGVSHIRALLADTLYLPPEDPEVMALAELVFQKTQGNAFFASQFITSLYARAMIAFDASRERWHWNLEQIQRQGITDNVAVLMAERISTLPDDTQASLKCAACIGNRFDLETISLISERSTQQVGAYLWHAVQMGLLVPLGDSYKYIQGEEPDSSVATARSVHYEFLHDRVQEAAYSLMSEDSRKHLHLRIGRLLHEGTQESQREERIFDIVNQLDQALELIHEPRERETLARLNLVAGVRAKKSSAYAAALKYLHVGVALLSADSWERSYALTFELYRHRSECFHLLGRFSEAEQDFDLVLRQARSALEKQEIYLLKLDLYVSRGQFQEALTLALEGLNVMGLDLPTQGEALVAATAREQAKLQAALAHRTPSSLLQLPMAPDEEESRRIVLLSRAACYAGYLHPQVFYLMMLVAVNRSLEHGLTQGSATCYSNYAVSLGEGTGDWARAHEFGQLAVTLSEQCDGPHELALAQFMFAAFVKPWNRPLASSLEMFERLFELCREQGLFFWAGLCSMQLGVLGQYTGQELSHECTRTQRHLDFYRRGGEQRRHAIYPLGSSQYSLLRLMHAQVPETGAPWHDDAVLREKLDNPGLLTGHMILRLRLSYLEEDYAQALDFASKAVPRFGTILGWYPQAECRFYEGLVMAALHPSATAEDKTRYEQTLAQNLEKLRNLSGFCAENFLAKHRLLAAEQARVLGQHSQVLGLYEEALEAALASGNLLEQGLANELMARFQLGRRRKRLARALLEEARYAYSRWGGHGKVAQLERRFPELLPPQSPVSETSSASALDLVSVLKASQALSGEIVLQDLLRNLMSTVLENAGAQRGVLLLAGSGLPAVEARQKPSGGTDVVLHGSMAEGLLELPQGILRYVERTRERVVLREAAREGPFQSEEYVKRQRLRSVLCMPVLRQKEPLGTLYLENNLVAGAFTPERCKVLELLSSQAAISLENARLYETLEQRVQARTRELHSSNEELSLALDQLKKAQTQLVMKEKLAWLGVLTSGIAHEIKNPLNFVNNFALLSVTLTEELENLVNQQRARLESLSAEQLALIAADLRENMQRIQEHGRRADGIVRSMLELSRTGGGKPSTVDLNALVIQFATLATQELRARHTASNLMLELELDPELKPVNAMPQELGRVLLNLVNNAGHALEVRKKSGEEFAAKVQVSTRELGEQVEIRVRDNGTGVPTAIREKIFAPFFTTKPSGQGTGLGLSISQDIIVQGHGGSLEVESQEGQYTEFIITLPR